MSEIKTIFYNLFWQNKACQNLFLLSKEELLDTIETNFDGSPIMISLPRVILSNAEKKEEYDYQTLRFRAENSNIKTGNVISSIIELQVPLFTNFFEIKFGKAFGKLSIDLKENPQLFFGRAFELLGRNKSELEGIIIEFLQEYGFIGKQLKKIEAIGEYFNREFISKDVKSVITENNVRDFLKLTKSIKDAYLNQSHKSLYSSNQVLVNSLCDTDDFTSRIKLFRLLYESGIITSSKEDAFVECLNCEPETYKGTLQLKINPKKLKDLECPICQNELTYHVPYELHEDIYDLVKLQDGLLLDALCDLLNTKGIAFKTNEIFSNDIEVDCIFDCKEVSYFIECKMYKVNTAKNKLTNKVRKHFGKLQKDINRILEMKQPKYSKIQAILLVNIADNGLLEEIEAELKENCSDEVALGIRIVNVEKLRRVLNLYLDSK